ncbi:MAG: hypothetical protein ABI036_20710 [Fibrobacteria bacterium]
MLKKLFLLLAMTTACAPNDKAAASGGDAMSATMKTGMSGNATFAASEDGTKLAFEKAGTGPALVGRGLPASARRRTWIVSSRPGTR